MLPFTNTLSLEVMSFVGFVLIYFSETKTTILEVKQMHFPWEMNFSVSLQTNGKADWEPTPRELLCSVLQREERTEEPEQDRRREETNVWECSMNAHTDRDTIETSCCLCSQNGWSSVVTATMQSSRGLWVKAVTTGSTSTCLCEGGWREKNQWSWIFLLLNRVCVGDQVGLQMTSDLLSRDFLKVGTKTLHCITSEQLWCRGRVVTFWVEDRRFGSRFLHCQGLNDYYLKKI